MKRLLGLILLASTLFMQCSKDEFGSGKASKFVKALPTTNNEFYNQVCATSQGYLLGHTLTSATKYTYDLLFFDKEGVVNSSFPFPEGYGGPIQLVNLASGDILGAGFSGGNPDAKFLITVSKHKASGEIIWRKNISTGIPLSAMPRSARSESSSRVVERPDKKLLLLVRLEHHVDVENQPVNALMCLDESGNFVWAKTLPKVTTDRNIGFEQDLVVLEDNSVIAAYVEISRSASSYRQLLCRMDENGNVLWSKVLQEDALSTMRLATIGQQVFVMSRHSGATSATLYQIGLNAEISVLGDFTSLPGSMASPHLFPTKDGNLMFICGNYQKEAIFIKISPKGQEIWRKAVETSDGGMSDVAACPDGGFVFQDGKTLYKTDANANVE